VLNNRGTVVQTRARVTDFFKGSVQLLESTQPPISVGRQRSFSAGKAVGGRGGGENVTTDLQLVTVFIMVEGIFPLSFFPSRR
jgi:hypothetical protein